MPPKRPALPIQHARSTARHQLRRRRRRRVVLVVALSVVGLLVAGVGVAVFEYVGVTTGIHRSDIALPGRSAAPGVAQNTGETNILLMGLDSRLDEDGKPLPQAIYDQIHAGEPGDGGYNTNVLMLIHIPAGGGKAVGISIPRDDYAALAGAPDGVAKSKIKEAYGLALDQKLRQLKRSGVAADDAYQQARAFGRQTESQTVSDFLGGVPIDHFIEVTMAAFDKVADVVQPITVCLNHATKDRYSGADFPAGRQQLNAVQAMSFVRQRRDTSGSGFELTDLDRTRRQQAFIVSLAYQLRRADTFANPVTLQSLIDTAKQYTALDTGFDLLAFASEAQRMAGGAISFQTLPITGYATIGGKDVNLVDLAAIRATVHGLIDRTTSVTSVPTPSPTPSRAQAPGRTTASARASAPARSATPAPASTTPANTYTDAETPLQSGAIPCVN